MKKSKIWIHVCVHLLLFFALGVYSSILDVNPVTDDISRLSVLRQNIPKDYKIPVQYIPKEEGGMCWVKLNVFNLETSLKDLALKFGNISSNKIDINIFVQMLEEVRCKINAASLDMIMLDFECHYREERWPTAQYFDFVKDFLIAAQNREDSDDCDPPPCPTPPPVVTDGQTTATPTPTCQAGCSAHQDPKRRVMSEVMERSLFSLLLIPLLALIFLLVWKVRSRRNGENLQPNPVEGGLFMGTEETAPPLNAEISEKSQLNVIEIV